MEERDLTQNIPDVSQKRKQTAAKIGLWGIVLLLTLCCSLLAGCLGVFVGLKMYDQSLTLDSIIASLKANSKDTLPSGQIAEVATMTLDSVVTVYGFYEEGVVSSVSSGVVIAKTDDAAGYYIATCCHGVDGFPLLSVGTAKGDRYTAEVVGIDFHTDIALLKVRANDLKVAKAREGAPYLGETIIAHGNPLGNVGISTSFGIVSQVEAKAVIGGAEQTLIKVDMALNHGNSGGGVFDMEGNLIGIASAKVAEHEGVMVEGVGYAIPSSILYSVISDLKTRGFVENRPYLGIYLQDATAADSQLVIHSTIKDLGLKEGDTIESIKSGDLDSLVANFGKEQKLTHAEALSKLKQFIVNAEEGDKVVLTVNRDGYIRHATITVQMTKDICPDV